MLMLMPAVATVAFFRLVSKFARVQFSAHFFSFLCWKHSPANSVMVYRGSCSNLTILTIAADALNVCISKVCTCKDGMERKGLRFT